jgi:predicted negative regulator of RcsB-dependent stress response
MKKILEFFKNWFSKNGIIKILVAFLVLMLCILFYRQFPQAEWLNIVGYVSLGYIVLTIAIFLIVGIVNSIKDRIR